MCLYQKPPSSISFRPEIEMSDVFKFTCCLLGFDKENGSIFEQIDIFLVKNQLLMYI